MLRVLIATALALALGAVLAIAAPGLSTRPYVPEPVEFELPAAPAPPGVAANRGFVSPEIHTPKRFNLVGLSWRGASQPGLAVRARKEGDAWTRWTPAMGDGMQGRRRSTSAPVWVGEADWVQYRMSRRVPGLRLHFVNTTGTATAKDRALTRLRKLAQAAVVRVAPAWGATVNRPRIRPRSEWGAGQCPTRGVTYGKVRAAVVHHTVTANEYSRAQSPAAILAVCRFHRNTNGWNDIGYNFVVDRFGQIWEGRAGGVDEAVYGSQAQGYNGQTTGIANLGTFTSVPQSDAAIGAMARLIRWKLANHGVPTYGTTTMTSLGGPSARYPYGHSRQFRRIIGHRDTGRTACPGEQLYYQLSDLRKRVGERRPAGARVVMDASLPEVVTHAPDGLTFTGRLLDRGDLPVPDVPVQLQQLRRTGWKRLSEGVTDAEGDFAATAKLKRYTILRWEFAGDETYRPFRGDGVGVQVAPLMTLGASATTVPPDEPVELSGTISPRKTKGVVLVVERYDDEAARWRRRSRRAVKPRSGAFAATRRFADEGRYRLSAHFAGDSVNVAGVSPPVEVTVDDPLIDPF
jgi:hypothetical protein